MLTSRWRYLFVSTGIAVWSMHSAARDIPNPLAAADAAAIRNGAHSAPLELRHGIPVVKVTVNGRGPFRFIVDTGTSVDAIVTPALAGELGLQVVDRRHLTDLSGQ